jgi:CheY-like chemotaxis protein
VTLECIRITPRLGRTFGVTLVKELRALADTEGIDAPAFRAAVVPEIRLAVNVVDPADGVTALNVLVVDGDPGICAVYDRVLRGAGFTVATATSCRAALAAVDRLAGSIDVVVVDVSLGEMDCTNLARDIADRIGSRPTLYVTAWANEFLNLFNAPGRWLVLQLPIEVPPFVAAIEWLAGRRATRPSGPSDRSSN